LTLDKTKFANVGANTVTLTVTDKNGNVATKTAIVTVEDKSSAIVLEEYRSPNNAGCFDCCGI
jgi:PKD repeat protein